MSAERTTASEISGTVSLATDVETETGFGAEQLEWTADVTPEQVDIETDGDAVRAWSTR